MIRKNINHFSEMCITCVTTAPPLIMFNLQFNPGETFLFVYYYHKNHVELVTVPVDQNITD